MKLSEAFSSFAAAVNPNNPGSELSIVRDASSATGNARSGYVWRLGDPLNPVLLSFLNSSKLQGYNASSSSAQLLVGLESAYVNDSSNGGYGSFSSTLNSFNGGMTYYAPDGSPALTYGGMLLVLMDTAAGQEFFSYTFAPIGSDSYQGNQTLLLFRDPNSWGWNVMLFLSNVYLGSSSSVSASAAINGTMVSASSFVPPPPSGSVQQLIRGCGLYAASQGSGRFGPNTVSARLPLPQCLWLGSNALSSPRRFGRCANPHASGGTFYQLGAGGSYWDLWLLLPTSTPAAITGWSTVGSMPWSTLSDRLSFCPLAPLQPLLCGPAVVSDFINDFPGVAVGIAGMDQQPAFAEQLSSFCEAGDGDGGGSGGGGGGGSARPSTGVLWPRGHG
ncbi:MAG: hypothetical protein R6W06_02790 [Prochlorococcaceae cyanobacterium]